MKLLFFSIGKPNDSFVNEGIELFTKRINNYYPASWTIIPIPKNAGSLSEIDMKKKEGDAILATLQKEDYLVLLDERGKQFTSEQFAGWFF